MKQPMTLAVKSDLFTKISVHIDDVEILQNAFVVQSLVSPLVRFSNRGRYEPYLATSWIQDGNVWTFDLRTDLTCEDGTRIDGDSYKLSLERSIRRFPADEISQTPFAGLASISSTGTTLSLVFTEPVGKALLEYLAMTPFAFICEGNFEGNGWADQNKFISSGPYRIRSYDPTTSETSLELRKRWPLAPDSAISVVTFTKANAPIKADASIDLSYGVPKATRTDQNQVLEVPRALLSVRLGIDKGRFFAKRVNRQILRAEFEKVLSQTTIPFENYHRAESFFFGQATGHEPVTNMDLPFAKPSRPLQVRTRESNESAEVRFYQDVLFEALKKLDWPFETVPNSISSSAAYLNHDYDVAFDRSHVDATLDPDFVRLLFKSNLGPRYQDPDLRIAHLVDQFDRGGLGYRDFLIGFNSAIAEESAVIPMYHRGLVWRFSNNLDTRDLSPLMSIIRFEDLKVVPSEQH